MPLTNIIGQRSRFRGTATTPPDPGSDDNFLLEDGALFLLETDAEFLLES